MSSCSCCALPIVCGKYKWKKYNNNTQNPTTKTITFTIKKSYKEKRIVPWMNTMLISNAEFTVTDSFRVHFNLKFFSIFVPSFLAVRCCCCSHQNDDDVASCCWWWFLAVGLYVCFILVLFLIFYFIYVFFNSL